MNQEDKLAQMNFTLLSLTHSYNEICESSETKKRLQLQFHPD